MNRHIRVYEDDDLAASCLRAAVAREGRPARDIARAENLIGETRRDVASAIGAGVVHYDQLAHLPREIASTDGAEAAREVLAGVVCRDDDRNPWCRHDYDLRSRRKPDRMPRAALLNPTYAAKRADPKASSQGPSRK